MYGIASRYARPSPRFGTRRTRAPAARASSAVWSVDESTIRISPAHPGVLKALPAPCDKLGDRQLLVQRGDDDREFGLGDVVLRQKQFDLRMIRARRLAGDRHSVRGVGRECLGGWCVLQNGQNVRMRSARALLRHPLAGPLVRYAAAGATVAIVYLAVPFVLNGLIGVPIEVAILLAYALAVTLHFNLQRHFVFRDVVEFALSVRQQIGRYLVIGAIQYPTTALAIAFVPGLLGVSQAVTYVLVTLTLSLTFFLLLRGHVFHPNAKEELIAKATAEQRAEHPGSSHRRDSRLIPQRA